MLNILGNQVQYLGSFLRKNTRIGTQELKEIGYSNQFGKNWGLSYGVQK